MFSAYRSLEEARQAFDAFARLEPRLVPLWDICRGAAPPVPEPTLFDDVYDVDPFAGDTPSDDWCAEQFFFDHVKSRLLLLAGSYRTSDPEELRSPRAYEALYDLLINWALHRPCACCAEDSAAEIATSSP